MHGFSDCFSEPGKLYGCGAMRRLIVMGLMAAMVVPAFAAKRVTVAQLEQSLAADAASHRTDADVAHLIGDFELSERLTDTALERFTKNLQIGPRTALALQLLADQSALLEPPASELPATATPDAATQQRMMDLARGYVVQMWPHLPNFFVTRTTARFDDSPQVLKQGDWPVRAGMHLVGTSTRNLTYRDGKEILDQATETAVAGSAAAAQPAQPERGMESRGDFGPELTIVLTDAAKGKVTWSHWEKTAAGLAARCRRTRSASPTAAARKRSVWQPRWTRYRQTSWRSRIMYWAGVDS